MKTLQSFIFCGKGLNLSPLCNPNIDPSVNDKELNNISEFNVEALARLPKALLPIAGKPMIEYVIDWCDQADFSEINVVGHIDEIDFIKAGLKSFLTLRNQQYELISKALLSNNHTHHLKKPKKINFVSTKSSYTSELLQNELLDKIHRDFVILPCDFITDIPPQIFLDQYQNRDDDNIAMAIYYKNSLENVIDKKQSHKNKQEDKMFTLYSENRHTSKQPVLLDSYSTNEVTKGKYLKVRDHLLWNYPNCSISKKLINSFIYFCSYELVQLLKKDENDNNNNNNTNMVSMENGSNNSNNIITNDMSMNKSINGNNNGTSMDKNSLIPIQSNLSNTTLSDNDKNVNNTTDNNNNNNINLPVDPTLIHPSYLRKPNNLTKDTINTKSSISKLFRDLSRRSWQHSTERETISIFILPEESTFIRSNDLNSYMDATRFILKIKSNSSNLPTTSTMSSTIGADSIVDSTATLMEKNSIKLSSINANCTIGNKCRISGSILLNNVQVDDECVLENVIIGPNAKIGKKSTLTSCYIEGNYVIDLKSNFKNEILMKTYDDDEFDEFGEYSSDAISDSNSDSSDFHGTESDEQYFSEGDFEDDIFEA
ncbi:similar to Saccharomyces cerevisiae YOR260W GCD1 Gamma subunit of the translation initiation factor eIF2B, the guanine-nucleotide exchange factor for eIF2 [Maudiozyma barnettii]|uniref:Translation initiation factor eIF2B subunit gamma n=1 Tax=Maudiozyma barnettii TaxID=61262 RepID=A0A8H2VCX4_9SACH|nr:translation initiation factor eIF2B subunit gamma [Kazachstania barnettii]CAB4252897.1 similar to Saccharomyces cerevisiae YOR260W GCD1 Gamma subunit of the translation initiation factor eIF2B, the guanine-nucleotide exchange factor for eIF2 [Kazachstania barnettii]CAD1780692.1 similar to Saccharomyces cerevisiae YOR260W GCD1 Gamma subunit of the translation initiation factor eIF2B, the guanine-nucleotide exchange factor for eIF2 [Kazachstania barnettii]